MATAIVNVVGYAAAVVGSVLMLPQAIQSWRTRSVEDLSLGMVVLYLANCLLWELYGLLLHAGPVIAANGIGLLIGAWQFAMRVSYKAPKQ